MAFNDAQKTAIRHREGPMLVLAGPGSGKTTVITNRVRYLTEKAGVDPSHILVITFTRAAAREMKERYEQIAQAGCSRVSFGTFHSVFFLILKLAYRYKAADIVREEQRIQYMKEMLVKCDLEVEDEGEFISSVLSEISMVKGELMDMDHYYAKNCSEDMFRQLYRGYEARLRQNRLLDFDDMLVMCYELIEMIVEKNNMHDFDSSMFFRWMFKSAFAILIVTNTWNIVMGVFDATQAVVNQSAGVIIGETSIDFDTLIPDLETRLEAMDIGPLLGLWFQTLVVGLTMHALSICIFLVTYGRMIEIYAVTALGPIPLATLGNAEWRGMGQNYLKSLLALGFQAFLIMVVVGIYAVLIQDIGTMEDISGAIWGCMGYTVLLCFCLFKTGSISKAVFTAH